MTKAELIEYINQNIYLNDRYLKFKNILYECPYCGTTGGHNSNCPKHSLMYCQNSTANKIMKGLKMSRIRPRPITTQLDDVGNDHLLMPNKIKMGGWFQQEKTYLWFGDKNDHCVGILSGQRLYRLAKAIVKQFEGDK
jgi:hypothetical protein